MILFHPSIDPVIFSIGFVEIRWYSLAYIGAFLIGSHLIKFLNSKKKIKIESKLVDNFFIWSVIGVLLGGRIGYVIFYQFEYFLSEPVYLLQIWKGGMSFHGGLLGMICSIKIFSSKNKIGFFTLADLISIVAPIGIFFGRIANFINVELIGRVTEFPFAIIYPTIDYLPRHPSQLYEAFFEGAVLFLILILVFFKNISSSKTINLSGLFLLFYGIFRFTIEFLREPDSHIGLIYNFLTLGQIFSIPLILCGLIILIKKYHE